MNAAHSPHGDEAPTLRLAIVCNEVPCPPTHGGRADVLRRIRALTAAGVDVAQLVTWCAEGENVPALQDYGIHADASVFPISRGWPARARRLAGLLANSMSVVIRRRSHADLAQLAERARARGVNAVLLDGLFGGELACALAQRLDVPLFVRSHNIEHQYLRDQYRAASGRTRLKFWLAARCVYPFEYRTLSSAQAVFDISVDDMVFWRARGLGNVHWLPPICEPLPPAANALEPVDVAYLGNLFSPNNVQGIRWLIEQVWPRVRAAHPTARMRIAGSKPTGEVVELCKAAPGVELLANVAVVTDVYTAARILVNPVLAGSGVNMKALEFLDSGAAVISTPQGAKGLPPEHQALFHIASSAEAFADAIVAALAAPAVNVRESRLPDCYRSAAVASAAQTMLQHVVQHRQATVVQRPSAQP
ncbi:MAG: glycosyltransferase [Burkholderiales bacterium]|nr:glycosyltransferase [Burkholderiales bacterium]